MAGSPRCRRPGRRLLAVAALSLAAWTISTPASADGPDDGAGLREHVALLERRLDDLQRQKESPLPVRLSGYVQVDWTVLDQSSQDEINWSTGQPLNAERFTLRRGHLRADAEHGLVSGTLELDASTVSGPQVRPVDAEVRVGWPGPTPARTPWFDATLGLMKIPFGFEVQELDYVRPFLERATVLRALFPGEFDLGARLRGRWRWLDYGLALMNGHPIGEVGFPAVDPASEKDMVGRVGIDTEVVDGLRLVVGVSGVTGTGFHEGTGPTKDVLVWRDVNEDGIVQPTELQVIAGRSATASQTFHRFALGGDLRLSGRVPALGELSLRAELVWASNLDRALVVADPVATGRDLRELGGYVGVTQELGPYATVGVRYDRYNPDADASAQIAASLVPRDLTFSTLAMMAMVHVGTQRLLVEYDRNGNSLGISPSGAPTTLAADTLTVRGQVTF